MTANGTIHWHREGDGIVVLTLDDPAHSTNTMNAAFADSMDDVLARLRAEIDDITGVVLTSAKQTFFAGGDLKTIIEYRTEDAAEVAAFADRIKAQLRALERLGRPVVAALNGSALGGGLELALACHHRVALNAVDSRLGFPEVTLGLLPGGGGVVRSVRLLGLTRALDEVLLSGRRLTAGQAQEAGLVDQVVVEPSDLLGRARAWIHAHPGAVQPWDTPGYQLPGGAADSPTVYAALPALTGRLRKQHRGGPMEASRNIVCAAVEGAQVDIDTASAIETRYFTELACGQTAKNMIQGFFLDLQSINRGASRPADFDRHQARTIAVLGAGMMGAGIAYAAARAGMQVLVKDVTLEAAERARTYAARALGDSQDAEAVLARIRPVDSLERLAGADLVIEAVFEDPDLKKALFTEVQAAVADDAVIASNTSTLPITDLATGVDRPEDFVGLHFFSPVERMPLVEIIAGERTSDATLAKAFDIVRQLGKTPIVVNDSRGFFTSRVILQRLLEAAAMVAEGVRPQTIEQASQQAGYPVGTLALLDELTLSLPRKIRALFRDAAEEGGGGWQPHPGDAVLEAMVEALDRPSRAAGRGFYEYDEGRRTRLWPGLGDHFAPRTDEVPLADLRDRLLFAEALDSVRCLEEGVLRSTADANVGSLYGIGFPAWTGGSLQFVEGYPGGVAAFVARAQELAARYGARFEPPQSLVERAATGERVA